jgi:predicted permease
VQTLIHDVRYGCRVLLKTPGFTTVAVLVLALGIGANTAMFSIVNAMLLQSIPSDKPDIVGIYTRDTTKPDSYRAFSWADYQRLRESREVFDSLLAHTMTMVGTTEGEATRRSFASIVSSNYFSTLGVRLAAGREFSADEERPGYDAAVVIVGHQYARKAGVSVPEVIGRTLRINGREYTVVGVAPEGFTGTMALIAPEFWLPLSAYSDVSDDIFQENGRKALSDPTHRPLMLVARLRQGLSARAAAPLLESVSTQFQRADPVENKNQALQAERLSRSSVSTAPHDDAPMAAVFGLLMGMSGLVLVIACLNLANMLLARGTSRRREIAVRLALGGGRWRIVRQLLTESLLIALLGGAAGLLLAFAGTRLLTASLEAVLPMVVAFDPRPDLNVLVVTTLFCAVSTIVAGLAPAWKVTKPDVVPDLKEQPRDIAGGRRFSMRNLLVVGQIALSLALLTAAGLFMRGAVRASIADPGFTLEGGLIANVSPSLSGYDDVRGRAAFRRVMDRVRALPGVESASLASIVPFGEFREGRHVQKPGLPPAAPGQREPGINPTSTIVGADYFETLRLPVLRGRGFTPAEETSDGGARVAILDEPAARQLFGNEEAIGRRVQIGGYDSPTKYEAEIVGVVAGVRDDIFDKVATPHVYLPFGQNYRGGMNLHLRLARTTPAAEAAMLATLRDAIRTTDEHVAILGMKSLRQHRDGSIMLWAVNSGARLFFVFGFVALLLAVIGVYGVKSYVVSRRTREIGIRMALGATHGDVVRLVLREGLMLTFGGVGIGVLLAGLVAKALSGMLYEVSALDPTVFVLAPTVLTLAALGASYVPARRATHVAPVTALRAE